MKKKVTKTSWGSTYTGSLSPGCRQCINGEKLVVLVSTECNSKCFYCPLSNERKASRHSFANERPIKDINDLELEASLMDAQGASMTGGDPLERHSFSKTLEFCRVLREKYSKTFHIHLYTRGKEINSEMITKLAPYINEIRFHVKNPQKDFEQIKFATQFDLDIGIEVPIIPTKGFDYYCDLIQQFETLKPNKKQFYFINFNELEVSETNYRNLLAHDLEYDPNHPSAVKGSAELAKKIVNWASINSKVPIHYCSLATKDTIQLTNRLYRIAINVQLPSDVVIPNGPDKGLLIRGVIQSLSMDLNYIKRVLIDRLEIPEELVYVDLQKSRVLTNAALLNELKDKIKTIFPDISLAIIEEYPTFDNLQTTYIPL